MSRNGRREKGSPGKSGFWTAVVSGFLVVGFAILMVLVLVALFVPHPSVAQAAWTDEETGVTYFVTEDGELCPRYLADGSLYIAP